MTFSHEPGGGGGAGEFPVGSASANNRTELTLFAGAQGADHGFSIYASEEEPPDANAEHDRTEESSSGESSDDEAVSGV